MLLSSALPSILTLPSILFLMRSFRFAIGLLLLLFNAHVPASGQSAEVQNVSTIAQGLQNIDRLVAKDIERAAALADSICPLLTSAEEQAGYFERAAALSKRAAAISRYDLCYKYSNQCRLYFDSIGQQENYLDHLLKCAQSQVFNGKHEEAKTLINECFTHLKDQPSRNNYSDYIRTLSHQGIMYAMQNKATDAIKSFSKADSLCMASGNRREQVAIAGYMGNIYTLLNQHELSIEYHEKSKEMALEVNDSSIVLASYDNIANALIDLNRFEEAICALEAGRRYAANGASVDLATNFTITAEALSKLERFDESRKYLNDALAIHRGASNKFGELQVLRTLAELYHDEGNFEMAVATAKDLVKMTWSPQYIIDRTTAHYRLLLAYDAMDNLERTHHHTTWYYWLRDSTNRQNFNAKVATLQDEFDRELKVREIELLKREAALSEERAARKDIFNRFLAIAVSIALIALIVLGYFLRIIRRSKREVTLQKKSLERSDAEKATLLKELHHRVKNNLQIVSSLLNLQSDSVTDPAALKAFREGQNRVDAMAMIHKHLYGSDELTAVDISAYLEQLVQSLAFSYGFDKNNFILKANISETPVDVDVAIPLGLIVNELVSNTFKHAFTDTEMAEISLELRYNDQLSTLVLKDNGKGLPADFSIDQSASFGLELVQTLVHQLKGEITFENENGAMFAIEINHAKTKVA